MDVLVTLAVWTTLVVIEVTADLLVVQNKLVSYHRWRTFWLVEYRWHIWRSHRSLFLGLGFCPQLHRDNKKNNSRVSDLKLWEIKLSNFAVMKKIEALKRDLHTETSVVRNSVLVPLSWHETTFVTGLITDRVVTREEMCGNASVWLGKRVSAHHASDMTSVTWTMLLANVVGRTTDPVLRVPAPVSEYVLVHLSRSGQIACASHTFFESKSAKIVSLATSNADVLIDAASGLPE